MLKTSSTARNPAKAATVRPGEPRPRRLEGRITHTLRRSPPWYRRIPGLARVILRLAGVPSATLDITVAGGARSRALNREYLGHDYPTDVLSFPLATGHEAVRPGVFLGDLVICAPVLERQARAMGHGPEQELAVLLTHGILHLLGHAHERPASRAAMQAAEARILGQLGRRHKARGGLGLIARAHPLKSPRPVTRS